jgi:hypothetical protein
MNKLITFIEDAQQSIFKYNISEGIKTIGNICTELETVSVELNDAERKSLNEILYYINMSLSNNDYLLSADFLQYELQPFLKERLN